MKNLITLLLVSFISISALAQAPQKFSYQSVIRNAGNQLVSNQQVGIKISILQGSANGAVVYTETHSPLTNANGLATLEIGGGSVLSGNFTNINWASGPYFVKTETDLNGGNNYTITNTQQLLSVPYALFSSNANTATTAGNGVPAGGTNGQFLTNCNGVPTWTTAGQCPGTIAGLNCAGASNSGTLTANQPAASVSSNIPYTGGGGGTHSGQTVSSTGVTGLTAILAAGTFASGAGSLTYTITGTPGSSGTASFALSIGGQTCTLTRTVNSGGSGPLNIETSLIPAGIFTMGSPTTEPQRGSDEVQHQVTLSAFRMSTYETTNAQFAAFLNARAVGSNGIYTAGAYPNEPLIYDCGSLNGLSYAGAQWQVAAGFENYPVICVTWYGAQEFATYAGGRLPTEAEWEYACRGGTTTAFSTGACLNNTQANYDWNYPLTGCNNTDTANLYQTQAVNSYSPNAYGLYNMHGNAWEWCVDWYGSYPTTAQTNPTGPSTGTDRVVRGGSWANDAQHCRSAFRIYTPPYGFSNNFGVRLAFAP